jgi:hypothetical protein
VRNSVKKTARERRERTRNFDNSFFRAFSRAKKMISSAAGRIVRSRRAKGKSRRNVFFGSLRVKLEASDLTATQAEIAAVASVRI